MQVDVLGDKGDLAVRVVLAQEEASSEDAVIDALAIRENAVELLELVGIIRAGIGIVNHQADCAAAFGRHAARYHF